MYIYIIGNEVPISGLLYYIIAPSNPMSIFSDPVQAVIFFVVSTLSCAILAQLWTDMESAGTYGSGSSAVTKSIADSLRAQNYMIKGHRDNNLCVK